MANNYLCHYGVIGMKWGIRRTPEQLGHRKSSSSEEKVKSITRTWSKEDRERMNLFGNEEYESSPLLVYRNIQYIKNLPVSFIDIEDYGTGLNVSIGTRSGEKYRGKGYASKCLKEGLSWYESNKETFSNKPLSWWAREENIGSNLLAKNAGFDYDEEGSKKNPGWSHYIKR